MLAALICENDAGDRAVSCAPQGSQQDQGDVASFRDGTEKHASSRAGTMASLAISIGIRSPGHDRSTSAAGGAWEGGSGYARASCVYAGKRAKLTASHCE